MENLLIQLLAAVTMHTGLPTADIGLPNVVFVERCVMTEVMVGREAGAACRKGERSVRVFWGIYTQEDDTLYLREDVPLDSIEGMGTLFHELVHFAQDKAGGDKITTDACENFRDELQAYRAEGQFIMQQLGLGSPAEAYEILGTGANVITLGAEVLRCDGPPYGR